jgi:hypothetical protein
LTFPTITADQRDALYQHILVRLTALSDLTLAVEHEEYEEADRLSVEFSDYLRLLHTDLGWEKTCREETQLTIDPAVLRRIMSRVKRVAEIEDQEEALERADAQKSEEQNRVIRELCDKLLHEIS